METVHCSPAHLKMLRLWVVFKIFLGIQFFKKKESVFILDPSAEVSTPSLQKLYGTGQLMTNAENVMFCYD
jgi:hypothetical protein